MASQSDFESQVYRKDGKVIWISENARAVRDDKGALLYYEGTVCDMTRRKQVEEPTFRTLKCHSTDFLGMGNGELGMGRPLSVCKV